MGQSSVILAFAATVLVAIFLVGSQRSNTNSDRDLAGYHNTMLAREASLTGINLSIRRLVDDPDNWFASPNNYAFGATNYNGASFDVAVTSTHPDTVRLVATGMHHSVVHRVEAVYTKGLISGGSADVFKYAVIADQDLKLNGQFEIRSASSTTNANIHTNNDLSGNSAFVEGYGTYGPTGLSSIGNENVFVPNDDVNGGDANIYSGNHVDVPLIDPSNYLTMPPSDRVVTGGYTLPSIDRAWLTANGYPAVVGTEDHPFLIYVTGNVSVGNVTIEGVYLHVVSGGDIHITGKVSPTSASLPSKNASHAIWDAWIANNLPNYGETTIGFYSAGDIRVNGNGSVVGQIYANGDVTINGGARVVGGVVSATGDIKMTGNGQLRFAEQANTGRLVEFFSDTPEGVRLVDWAEF